MTARLAALYRHPVKGFTPERRPAALLEAAAYFPGDRMFAVENGPSGFDPAAPAHVAKSRFTVLAAIPALARARTAYDEASCVLRVQAPGAAPFAANLNQPEGRDAFADWLTGFIPPEDRRGPLKVLEAPRAHRFMDDRTGAVSLINLDSVRDLERRVGRAVDPLRFRGNLYVEGLPAWSELDLAPGEEIAVGEAVLRVVKPIVRCAATHVDPESGERDLDLVPALRQHYGRLTCGLYLSVVWGGLAAQDDPVRTGVEAPQLVPSEPARPALIA